MSEYVQLKAASSFVSAAGDWKTLDDTSKMNDIIINETWKKLTPCMNVLELKNCDTFRMSGPSLVKVCQSGSMVVRWIYILTTWYISPLFLHSTQDLLFKEREQGFSQSASCCLRKAWYLQWKKKDRVHQIHETGKYLIHKMVQEALESESWYFVTLFCPYCILMRLGLADINKRDVKTFLAIPPCP